MDDMAVARATEIDKELYICLTRETLDEYNCVFYELEELEGNYIEEYEKKEQEGLLEVSEYKRNYINETGVPLHSFDLRTGVYGKDYAAAGFYSAGAMYMLKQDYDQAIANFAKSRELRPRNMCAYLEKAKAHYAKKEYWYAACESWNAILLNPVKIAEEDEKSSAVLKQLTDRTRTELEKYLIDSLYLRAAAFWYAGYYDEAFEDYTEIIKRLPTYINAYHGHLMVLMEFRDYEKALEDCEKLLSEGYEVLYALQCRGIAYNNLERIDEAITDFDSALSMNPDLAVIYTSRSNCYYKKKDYLKAVSDAGEAIRLGDGEAFFYRGIAYSALGEYDKAIADFDEALRFDNEDEFSACQREKAVALKARPPEQV